MLFLTHARKRNLYGNSLSLPISPFLDSIKEGLVKRGIVIKWKKRVKDSQLPLFR